MKLEFVTELPKRPVTRRDLYADICEELRTHPGQWAKWPHPTERPYALTSDLNRGRYAGFTPEHFEARTVNGETYVRYRGR